MQRTLDYYFCGRKRDRDVSIDDEDLLECWEEVKRQQKEEEEQKKMDLIWEFFEEDLLMEALEDELAEKFKKEMAKKKPFFICRELTADERIERRWNVGKLEEDFQYLPNNEDTLERKYWVESEKIRLNKKIEEDPYYN